MARPTARGGKTGEAVPGQPASPDPSVQSGDPEGRAGANGAAQPGGGGARGTHSLATRDPSLQRRDHRPARPAWAGARIRGYSAAPNPPYFAQALSPAADR